MLCQFALLDRCVAAVSCSFGCNKMHMEIERYGDKKQLKVMRKISYGERTACVQRDRVLAV